MTPDKIDPATQTLRAPPRPVTRLNRRTLAIAAGGVVAVVLGATIWSLQMSRRSIREPPVELHNVERVNRAEGLDQLPRDYSKMAQGAAPTSPPVPVLGPPLPGDLGGPLLRAEREGARLEAGGNATGPAPGAPGADPYADAARAERLNRQREAEEAAKGTLFFKVSGRRNSAVAPPATSGAPAATLGEVIVPDPGQAASSNGQGGKQQFLSQPVPTKTQSRFALTPAASPYLVLAGTIIPAALVTGINSDLPGPVIASVTESVYDSATGKHLLIPQGSRLLGQYDSKIAFGQRRVLLVWTRLILPDASSIALERLPGVDSHGQAGLGDDVDWHWQQLLAGAALSTLIGIAAELAAPDRNGSANQVVIATRGSLQDSINQTGQELVRKNLDIQPTLTVRAGFPVRVIVNQDLTMRPYQPMFFERGTP